MSEGPTSPENQEPRPDMTGDVGDRVRDLKDEFAAVRAQQPEQPASPTRNKGWLRRFWDWSGRGPSVFPPKERPPLPPTNLPQHETFEDPTLPAVVRGSENTGGTPPAKPPQNNS